MKARAHYGAMPGVTPLDEPATRPVPGSSGVTVAPPPVVAYGPDDAEYGGAVAIVADVVESLTLPSGAGYGTLTAEPVVENGVAPLVAGGVEFIEVGPISVVLNGVSALPPDGAA